jgi:DDE superfamily endonuclease
VNADAYLEILSEGFATFINELLISDKGSDTIRVATDDAFLFMHDNAPHHTAKKVQQYLKNQRIPIMKWPAQSPDLNPIENLWVDFKERCHKAFLQSGLQVSTREDVTECCKELLKQVWRDQGADLIMKLVESMPRRVAAVIAAKCYGEVRAGHDRVKEDTEPREEQECKN